MPKQNQANEVQQDKKNRAKVQPPVLSPDLTGEKAGLPPLPDSLLAAGANSIEAQAARLGDSRLQTAQRQGVAGQIGRTQGNLHLQRVVAALKPDQRTTSASPSNSKPSGSSVLKKSASPTAARQAEATESPGDDRFDEFLGGSGSPSLAPPPLPPDKNGQKMAVQRDGTSRPPVPNFTLTTPSLLQPPDPASRYNLGMDTTLRLDPEIQAKMTQYVQQQLDPANLRGALSQIQLESLPTAAPGAVTTPATASPGASGAAPTVPAGPDTPRTATAGDLMGAVLAVPAIDSALTTLQSQALDRVSHDWRNLGTGGQIATVSTLAVIGLGALGGAMSDPAARQLLVDQLNGRTVPVPGLNWMRLEVNTSADNLMLGMHVDVGQLLPASWGFGPSSPSAIGGPPTPQPFVPGQRTASGEIGETGPSEDMGARIQAKAGGGKPLDEAIQRHLEDGLGADMSNVRVHTDREADELAQSVNAVAFTTGQDIFFQEGTYNPNSTDGLKLLAHEATHTVQQAAGPVAGTPTAGGVSVSDPGDRFEQAAEQAAEAVVQRQADHEAMTWGGAEARLPGGRAVVVQRAVSIQRQPASMAPLADKITSDDPEHLRQILEEVAIGHGMDNAEKFVDDFSSSPRGAAANDPQLAERIKAGLRTQLAELKNIAAKLMEEFERLGLNAISEMLNESEKILQAEAEKYGLHEIPREITGDTGLERAHQMEQGGTGQYTVEDNEKTRGMAAAAAELAPKRKELDDLITKQQELIEETPVLAGHGGKIITDQKKFDELGVEIRDKEVVYNSLRAKLEAEYPLLAAYASEKGGAVALEQVARGPGASGPMIAETIRAKLKNIDEVRQGIADDKVKVWKLPVIANGVKGQLGYTPGTLGHKLVEEKMAALASKDALINLAVAAVSIALGLVAALPTGGASVGVSLAVGAAAAGSAVISGVQAVKAMQDYQLAQAMNGSAVDKAKAISQEDPSLFWLALDIVGAVLDVYGALKTFKQVAPAVREALAARRAVSEIGEEGSEEAVQAAAQAKQKADELKKSLEGVPEPAKSNIVNQVEGPQKGWLLNPDKPMSSGGFAGSLANKPGCGVFEGHIPQVPDKTVVIKIYPADDEELMKVFAREKEGAAAAAQTSMGPKYYGEVDMGPGKRAFAMEKVAGDMPEDMSEGVSKQAAKEASKAAQSIKLKTLDDVRAYANQVWEKGYYCHGDLQGLIDEAGNWRPIDFQGVYKRPPVEDVAATADALKQHNWQVSQYNKYLIGQMPEGPYKDLLPPINPPPRAVQPYREPGATPDMKQPDGSGLAQRIEAAGTGHPLDAQVQPRLEASLGADLTAVRVHTDQEADELAQSVSATAFTTGQDIFFREGAYNPNSTEGLKLLAHEATHTVQQAAGPVEGTPTAGGVSVSDPGDRFEQAAEQAADAVVMRQGGEEASSGLAYELNLDSAVGGPKGRLGTRSSALSPNIVIARQPAPPTPGPAAKGKAPDAAGMVAAQYPRLNLPADKMAILQKVFEARFELERLADKMKPYEGSILSEDARKREAIQAEMAPHQDFLYKNQALVIPTEGLLAGDILGEEKPSNYTKEIAFRESLYKTLITHSTGLVIGAGLEPKPLFTYKWGPNGWVMNHEGGQITFKNVMQVEKFNIAYQAVLTGEMKDILSHMEKLARQAGGKILSITGQKIGEAYGHIWNTTIKVGNELGPITGYANDPQGRVELEMDFAKFKGARMIVAGPDNWLHIFSLNPNLNCYDMKEPDDDGYVYLLDKGNQVSGIQRIITNDGRELERGVTESGSGWRTKKELSELEQFSIGAILGDAFEDPSASMTFGQIVMGVIPVVGQVADARDVAVGIYKMWNTGGKDGKLQTAMALIGFIPLLGDGVKSAWKAAKGAGKEAADRAVREAIQKAAPAAQETLAKKLLQNADEVLQAFPHLSKEEVKALTKSLNELGEKALKEGGEAAKQYAEEMAKHFDQLGGNAGALVQISGGKWAKTAKTLAATPEGAALGKRMQDWRVAQFDELNQKMSQKAVDMGPDLEDVTPPNMLRTGTPSFTSDVDISFLGPSATSHRNAAIRMMEQSYGPGWRDLLDADIFADPTRLHMFEGPLKEIGGKAAKEAEKRIVKESELNVLAKMMKDGADPEAVKAMAKEMGVSMADVAARQKEVTRLSTDYLAGMMKRGADRAEVEKLAAEMGVSMEDVARHMASGEDIYRQMELKLDVLHKRFLAAEGDPVTQAAIAEEMAALQGKLNAAIPGPYMTPGGGAKHVTRRTPDLRPAEPVDLLARMLKQGADKAEVERLAKEWGVKMDDVLRHEPGSAQKGLRPSGPYQAMSPALGYTALLDDLYMLQHALDDVPTKGFTEKSAKAMAKYADRILVTAGQFGVDMGGKSIRPLFDSMADLLAAARKDPAALARATEQLNSAKGMLDGQIMTILDAVKKNADDYLAQTPGLDAGAIMKMVADSKRTLLRQAALIARVAIRSEQELQPAAPANQD